MSVEVIKGDTYSCLMCNTSMWTFGGVFYEDENADEFLKWLIVDPRDLTDPELARKMAEWRALPVCEWCETHREGERKEHLGHNDKSWMMCPDCWADYHDDDEESIPSLHDIYRDEKKEREAREMSE